jgi:trimethylamine--corrinoid protein Co-methyltransferase
VTTETLALELIHETGPDGQYLNKKHTVSHFRDQWHPLLFERYNYEGWVKQGSKTLAERAAERVNEILISHKTEPLPEKVKEQLREIVQNANR